MTGSDRSKHSLLESGGDPKAAMNAEISAPDTLCVLSHVALQKIRSHQPQNWPNDVDFIQAPDFTALSPQDRRCLARAGGIHGIQVLSLCRSECFKEFCYTFLEGLL